MKQKDTRFILKKNKYSSEYLNDVTRRRPKG